MEVFYRCRQSCEEQTCQDYCSAKDALCAQSGMDASGENRVLARLEGRRWKADKVGGR
jgi:hypothetical protein